MLIEPSPRRFVEYVANRRFGTAPKIRCAACVPFGFSDRFIEIEDSDLMSVAEAWMYLINKLKIMPTEVVVI